ncbi:hypothetical protein [Mesorhizobium sp. J428]|uniref:hypothetical protein n=1 Tax=Mesorhizobium sp. J428 TaxID=2898440 RepID=UPI002151C191|nr:hypothetical protein [Mesorhizobium sp. J428]MCR5857568.1 hypothetical protein [Mesorhizobium sp. J428]
MSVWDGSDWESGIDWDGVIERNVRLLGPIVATLCVMAGLALSSPLVGEDGPARQGEAEALAGPGEGDLSPSPTLPRRWHRAVYRLLRAAEAAVRRLIIVVGRDMVAAEPVLAPLKTSSGPLVTHIPVRPGLGLACAAPAEVPAEPDRTRKLAFCLLDPLPDPTRPPFMMRSCGVPRISVPGWTPLFSVAPRHEPSPNDPIDAGYLRRRVDALSRALADLPRQALRLARWRARCEALRKARRLHRVAPLRPGRAYGLRRPASPRPEHPIDDILRDLHYFAWEAQERRDTS